MPIVVHTWFMWVVNDTYRYLQALRLPADAGDMIFVHVDAYLQVQLSYATFSSHCQIEFTYM